MNKKTICVGVMLAAIAKQIPAVEAARDFQNLLNGEPAYSVNFKNKVWMDGKGNHCDDSEQLELWGAPYVAIGLDMEVKIGNYKAGLDSANHLKSGLDDLGIKYFIYTRGKGIVWFSIVPEPDMQIAALRNFLTAHSMMYFEMLDSNDGYVFGPPNMGETRKYPLPDSFFKTPA